MSIHRSPVVTRSHASAAAEGDRADARDLERETGERRVVTPRPPSGAAAPEFLLLLEELRGMREEQAQQQREFVEALRRLQSSRATENQLSLSDNIRSAGNVGGALRESGASMEAWGDMRAPVGIKLKPDTFDGTSPLREFLTQFSLIANANRWSESEKAVVLASCLRGKARSLLDSCSASEGSLSFVELKSQLELRFGESELAQNFYTQFTNRKQSPGEDYATLGADLERLSRKAYSECTHEVRDKIACSQFIAALSDGFVKRTLQVEGITSLRVAIERAKTLKFINQSCFPEKFNGNFRAERKEVSGLKEKEKKNFKGSFKEGERKNKECWQCGATGHFRAECPAAGKSGN